MKEITKEFINFVKKISAQSILPPIYDPSQWKGSFNCYAYALNISSDFIEYRIYPGFISNIQVKKYDEESLIYAFKEDCKVLKLQTIKTTIDEKIDSNEYKIALYLNSTGGFHFTRQDNDGGWSEKEGWWGKIEILEKKDITKCIHGYKFVGIYRVSRKE